MKVSMSYNLIILSVKNRDFSDSVPLPLLAPDSNPSLPQWGMLSRIWLFCLLGRLVLAPRDVIERAGQNLRSEQQRGKELRAPHSAARHRESSSTFTQTFLGTPPTAWKGSLVYLQLMILANWPEQSGWAVALQSFLVVEKEMQPFLPSLSYGSWPN